MKQLSLRNDFNKGGIQLVNFNAVQKSKEWIAALAYINVLRWPVFPLHSIVHGKCTCSRSNCENAGKHPRTANGFKDATTDEMLVNEWWSQWPNSNIGVPTGAASGFFALDMDPRHGGNESFEDLINGYGEFPPTVEAITGSGGRHLLFKYDKPIGNKTNIKPGIDIRGDGGYIVVAPSLHHSGRKYEWELSSRPNEIPIADAPEWLLHMISTPTTGYPKTSSSQWVEIMHGIKEGGRNDSAAKLTGHLLRRGIDLFLAAELLEMWNERNNPPLPIKELERTFNSIAEKEAQRRAGQWKSIQQ